MRPRTHGDCIGAEKRTPAEGGASLAYGGNGRSSRAATRRVAGRDKNSDELKYLHFFLHVGWSAIEATWDWVNGLWYARRSMYM
jgi:hypothetical protein